MIAITITTLMTVYANCFKDICEWKRELRGLLNLPLQMSQMSHNG